ncbi:energy transducer TonB [Roseomonas sp. CAU 1739]|uniref:energy transducer TonB n=1 Tax=Roseomonas sp. CAU 1739 TaxID=3140364 RepID=UPI00325A8E4B
MLLLSLAASGLIHAGILAALLLWPDREPVEEPGEIGSVALVFDDTVAQGGGAPVEQAPPPVPPAPPATPAPPAPPPAPQAAVPPPPPMPAPPQAAAPASAPPAPPPPPVAPDAPHDFAALPPDPAGDMPAPPPPRETMPEAAIAPPPAPEAPQEAPAPEQATPAPTPQPAPSEAQQAEADPLPPPPPLPPAPPQQQAAAQPSPPAPPPAPPPRRQAPPAAAQGPVRLDAGSGDASDRSMGSFALGAVIPPGADSGHRNNPPDYPADARRRGEEGVVRLALQIDADGRVTMAEVAISSGYPALDRAAVEAARRWRFRPATRVGMPVAATLSTAVHFRLSDARGR